MKGALRFFAMTRETSIFGSETKMGVSATRYAFVVRQVDLGIEDSQVASPVSSFRASSRRPRKCHTAHKPTLGGKAEKPDLRCNTRARSGVEQQSPCSPQIVTQSSSTEEPSSRSADGEGETARTFTRRLKFENPR